MGLSIESWWFKVSGDSTMNQKVFASLTLLTSWEIWDEHNARIFQNKHVPSLIILDKIKKEARIWVKAGAKTLSDLVPGE
jgi:chemotaxis methyl-accepting protein methylase